MREQQKTQYHRHLMTMLNETNSYMYACNCIGERGGKERKEASEGEEERDSPLHQI